MTALSLDTSTIAVRSYVHTSEGIRSVDKLISEFEQRRYDNLRVQCCDLNGKFINSRVSYDYFAIFLDHIKGKTVFSIAAYNRMPESSVVQIIMICYARLASLKKHGYVV